MPWLLRWWEWPFLLRLRRPDWLSDGHQLQSPAALPAGWYVLSIRCRQADNAVQPLLPGQACALGRGQLRRRVLRLRRRRVLRLSLVAPLRSDDVDRLDLRRVPALRAWALIHRKLRRFQLLERGHGLRHQRWLLYNRLLARSGAGRIRLDQWLQHVQRIGRRDQGPAGLPAGEAEWVLLNDPGVELVPGAAAIMAAAGGAHPGLDLMHADLLDLDVQGRPIRAVLLPIWDRELFRANPRCHGPWWVRRERLDRCRQVLGDADLPTDGAMLRLELLQQLSHDRIGHLPRPLARRLQPVGAAELDDWQSAVRTWYGKRCPGWQVSRDGDLGLRLDPPVSIAADGEPERIRVSIIIPTRDRVDLLSRCLASIQNLTEPLDVGSWEVVVVDNGSTDVATLGYLQQLQDRGQITCIRDDGPFNYSRLNNRAVALCRGKVLLFLNNDTEVISGHWLQRLVAQAERADVGAVGACLLFADGSVQHGGVVLGIGGVAGHAHKYRDGADEGDLQTLRLRREFAAVTAAAMAVARDKFEAVGGFDASHLAVNYNDVDLCLRLVERGWRNLCCPDVRLYHHESRSRGAPVGESHRQWQLERATMLARWGAWIASDPWYNPHFSRHEENFSLRLLSHAPLLSQWPVDRKATLDDK